MKISRPALAVTALLLVTACGAADVTTKSSDGAQPNAGTASSYAEAPGVPAPDVASSTGSAGGSRSTEQQPATEDDGGGASSSRKVVQAASVISQGQVSVETEDVDKARFDLKKLLDRWHGQIANEESSADDRGRTERESLELRVPSTQFDTAMDELSDLGTLVDRSRSSRDVSTEVVDNRSRVRSQRLSLARVQALMARARTIEEVIAIEAQLSQRQADLDSLVQQQSYLADQTSLATIHLYLSVPEKAAKNHSDDDSGFLSGLRSGWHHLGEGTGAVLTALGAALPFAGLAALLLGLPLWIRRRRRA